MAQNTGGQSHSRHGERGSTTPPQPHQERGEGKGSVGTGREGHVRARDGRRLLARAVFNRVPFNMET